MTDTVGRRPTLVELILAIGAIVAIEADANALDSTKERFRVVLTFERHQCPQDWQDGQPKPSWLFAQILEELLAWRDQRIREEQWVSKDEHFGASIDTLMGYYTEELKAAAAVKPENLLTRALKQTLSNTVLRLQELKERRAAGGVYSRTESRREKARKVWMEDEFEAPKREEAQNRARERMEGYFGWDNTKWHGMFEDLFGTPRKPPPPPPPGKKPWFETLGVSPSASKREIKSAHRKLVSKYQPRTSADAEDRVRAEKMMEINTARDEGLEGL